MNQQVGSTRKQWSLTITGTVHSNLCSTLLSPRHASGCAYPQPSHSLQAVKFHLVVMLCRRLLYLLPPSLSWRASLLLTSKFIFLLRKRKQSPLLPKLPVPPHPAPAFQRNLLHWLKSFSFSLSTAFSPHLCLKMCSMSQNPSVASCRKQHQCTLARKRMLFQGIQDVSRNPMVGMPWCQERTWTWAVQPSAVFPPYLSAPLSLLHFVHSLLVASYPQGRIPVPGARTVLDSLLSSPAKIA